MKISNYIIRLLSIIQLVLLYAFVMHIESLISAMSQTVLICGIMMIVVSATYSINKKMDMLILIVYSFFLCFASYSYELLIRTICFVMMFSAFDIGLTIKIDKTTSIYLFISYILQALLLIIISYSPLAYSIDLEVENRRFLSLGFPNPNTTGVVLFSTVLVLIILYKSLFHPSSKKLFNIKFILILIVVLFLSRLLYLTNSRTSFVVCLLAVLLFFYYKCRSKKQPFPKFVMLLLLLLPIVYYFTYLYLSAKGIYSEIMIMDKPLFSGREEVFEATNAVWTNHWFGNAAQLKYSNSHNVSLTIAANIGIIGFILYESYYLKRLFQYNKFGRDNLALLAICALFVHGCNEAVMFTGGSIFFVYVLNLCLLVQVDSNAMR